MRDLIQDLNPSALMLDKRFDSAVIGTATRCGMSDLVVYNRDDVINIIIETEQCSYEDAIADFDYNYIGAYDGEGTPLFLDTSILE